MFEATTVSVVCDTELLTLISSIGELFRHKTSKKQTA